LGNPSQEPWRCELQRRGKRVDRREVKGIRRDEGPAHGVISFHVRCTWHTERAEDRNAKSSG
jgi:hypothetical protein